MPPIRPILSSLARHKAAVAILLLEIALTCAILCNAFDLIHQRLNNIDTPTGVDEAHLIEIVAPLIKGDKSAWPSTQSDIAALRDIPGVVSVASTNQVPLQNSSSNTDLSLTEKPDSFSINTALYLGDNTLIETLGLRLIAGRMFEDDEVLAIDKPSDFTSFKPNSIILSEEAAKKLFPDTPAVGKQVFMGEQPLTIVGVVKHFIRPSGGPSERKHWSMIAPTQFPAAMGGHYILRTEPGFDQSSLMNAAREALSKHHPKRIIIEMKTFQELRQDYYANEQSMAKLLSLVSIILLVVTAFGIVGLASFWVQQRTKQIGVRRALGATKTDVLRYFQTENFLIVTAGIVLGMLLAFGINQLLMDKYELSRLPLIYLPMGALVLWVLGQIAVYWPARKAANIPPATATRSV